MTAIAGLMNRPRDGARAGVSVRTLAATLLWLFAADNLLLLHFLGLPLLITAALVLAAGWGIAHLCINIADHLKPLPYSILAVSLAISLALFALGGEGRFFYANVDWQVRDAVLRDMATHTWPFGYTIGGEQHILRAPLGTYLLPSMFGPSAEVALLVFNSLRLTLLFALAWQLFESGRERLIALAVFLIFSGWDLVGILMVSAFGVDVRFDHIEPWNGGNQYSSHLTQIFWVPQHAIAGWTCAVTFLLWRKGLMPVGSFAAAIPLVAIWSPLAVIGAVPFALLAAVEVLRRRSFGLNDVGLAAAGLAIALPALFYLQVDAASLGLQLRRPHPLVWLACIAFEVLPFILPMLRKREWAVADKPVVMIILLLLALLPLVQIGVNSDLQMRASIMPLALLSMLVANWLCRLVEVKPVPRGAITYALAALALGAATPLLELRRTLVNAPSPRPLCSLIGVWHKQDNMRPPYSTYLAPIEKMPTFLPEVRATAGLSDPEQCWDHRWVTPDFGRPAPVR